MRSFGTITAQREIPRLNLPAVIPCPVGETIQLFHRAIVETPLPNGYYVEVRSTIGKVFPRYWEYTGASGDIGNKTVTWRVVDSDGRAVTSRSTTVQVYSTASMTSDAKTVLCIGDSLSDMGEWQVEFGRRLSGTGGSPAGLELTNVSLVGHQGNGSIGWMGFPGWRWNYFAGTSGTATRITVASHDKDYTDAQSKWSDGTNQWIMQGWGSTWLKFSADSHANAMPASGTLTRVSGGTHAGDITFSASATEPASPLWDPAASGIRFSTYCSNYSISTIDFLCVLLGWNQGVDGDTDADFNAAGWTQTITDAKVLLDRLHIDYPSAKVLISGIQMPSLNGGLGYNYNSGNMAQTFRVVKAAAGINEAYQALCAEAGYSGWCKYVPLAQQFDSEYNMPTTTKAVNTRSAITETIGINGVHPGTDGNLQIADAMYRSICQWLAV